MKRKALFILFIFGFTAMTWAEGSERRRGPNRRQVPPSEAVTISGTLTVAYGMPAVRSGDSTYLVGRLNRLTGFIDDLREGAQVTIEGSAVTSRRDSNLKFLNPSRLTLGGRSHDLSSPARAFGFDRQFGAPQGSVRQFNAPRQNRHQRLDVPQRGRQHRQHSGGFRR